MTKPAEPLIHCDVTGCDRRAIWVHLDDNGDLYLCEYHRMVAYSSTRWAQIEANTDAE